METIRADILCHVEPPFCTDTSRRPMQFGTSNCVPSADTLGKVVLFLIKTAILQQIILCHNRH
ncbi:MAG: hypothetical protein Q9P01_21640 [Anaerolineae bacterium]|nr:hypothetical protein [Anaerolineae bacterium]